MPNQFAYFLGAGIVDQDRAVRAMIDEHATGRDRVSPGL
jgi:hypothetical protein